MSEFLITGQESVTFASAPATEISCVLRASLLTSPVRQCTSLSLPSAHRKTPSLLVWLRFIPLSIIWVHTFSLGFPLYTLLFLSRPPRTSILRPSMSRLHENERQDRRRCHRAPLRRKSILPDARPVILYCLVSITTAPSKEEEGK